MIIGLGVQRDRQAVPGRHTPGVVVVFIHTLLVSEEIAVFFPVGGLRKPAAGDILIFRRIQRFRPSR